MSDELKPCPFCGATERLGNENCVCGNDLLSMSKRAWNTRPIEDALRQQVEQLTAELQKAREFHPRAMKLIGKRKNFVVVAVDEPYFIDVYQTIRANELKAGRWTNEDECQYQKYPLGLGGQVSEETKNQGEIIVRREYYDTLLAKAAERELAQVRGLLRECLPYIREDYIDIDSGELACCGGDGDGDHSPDCKQTALFLAMKDALHPEVKLQLPESPQEGN